MTALTTTALWPSFGLRVEGVDLHAEIPPDLAAQLRDLMARHHLLLFRDPALSADDQVRVVSTFGTVIPARPGAALYAQVRAGEDDVIEFHSDYSFTESPLAFVSLYGEAVVGSVATTAFVDAVRAAAKLPPRIRARLTQRTVTHASDIVAVGQRSSGKLCFDDLCQGTAIRRASHPALLCHPQTGDEVLYVNEYFSVAVDGVSRTESEALLGELFEQLYTPNRVYHHHWSAGDLLVFDNVALQHSRTRGVSRTLRRVIVGDRSLANVLAGGRHETA